MEVTLLSHPIRTKKNLEQDHYWYDSVQKKMLYGRGGRMIFVYDKTQKRLVPRIVDQERWTTEQSFPTVLEWVELNKDKYGISVDSVAPGHYINVQVDARHWGEMSRDLHIHKIRSDYDEAEMRKELR